LTEITAAVLERVNGLACRVIDEALGTSAAVARQRQSQGVHAERELWKRSHEELTDLRRRLSEMVEPRVRVKTQRPTKSSPPQFVDLELRVTPRLPVAGETLLFWIEVKHGAWETGTQLKDYLQAIEWEDADLRRVLALVPRQDLAKFAAVPPDIPVVEWQQVGAAVRSWQQRPDLGAVDRFLIRSEIASTTWKRRTS
jgi:hypothetical protein